MFYTVQDKIKKTAIKYKTKNKFGFKRECAMKFSCVKKTCAKRFLTREKLLGNVPQAAGNRLVYRSDDDAIAV